jgi:YVTN family beta-propeller protein
MIPTPIFRRPRLVPGICFMHSNNSNGSRAARARGFAALCAVLAMGLASMASPADAAPFAYVVNAGSNTVSVIDTATNAVLFTIPVGLNSVGALHCKDRRSSGQQFAL